MKRMVILLAGFALLGPARATDQVLIGTRVGNGDFQTLEEFAGQRSGRPLEILKNDTGRRLVKETPTDTRITFPGWNVKRSYYKGGNGSWGLDGHIDAGMPGWPNTFFIMNSGDAILTSNTHVVDLQAGDRVSVSFDLIAESVYAIPASCAGRIDLGGGQTVSWTATDGAVTAGGQLQHFAREFVLERDASELTLALDFSTGRGQNGDPDRSANQTRLDNVYLSVSTKRQLLGLITF